MRRSISTPDSLVDIVSENTVAPRTSPIACCSVRLQSQSRSVRGENWVLASCTATSIIDSSSVIDVIRPPAIAEKTDRALSILYGLWIAIRTLVFGIDVPGWSTLVVAVMMLGGVQLISIGVLGEYLARVFTEVKGRPGFIVAEDVYTGPEHS